MVRSWIRQALRASGVAILVPAAIVAAIALSVVGGGGNVGSLAEVLRGPAVPPAEAAEQAPPRRSGGLSPQSHVRLRGLSPQSHLRLRGLSPQSHPPVRTLPVRRLQPRRPAAHHPAPAPAPAAPPPAQPAPRPHPIHDAGTQVAQTLAPLPLAGPAAAGAVQAVVNLVDPA